MRAVVRSCLHILCVMNGRPYSTDVDNRQTHTQAALTNSTPLGRPVHFELGLPLGADLQLTLDRVIRYDIIPP